VDEHRYPIIIFQATPRLSERSARARVTKVAKQKQCTYSHWSSGSTSPSTKVVLVCNPLANLPRLPATPVSSNFLPNLAAVVFVIIYAASQLSDRRHHAHHPTHFRMVAARGRLGSPRLDREISYPFSRSTAFSRGPSSGWWRDESEVGGALSHRLSRTAPADGRRYVGSAIVLPEIKADSIK